MTFKGLHGLILVSSSLFYKINFFNFILQYLIFIKLVLLFFFFAFLSIRLSKSHAHSQMGDLGWLIYFLLLFFTEFQASTFFHWEFCYIVLFWVCLLYGQSQHHNHEFWKLTTVDFGFFCFFNFTPQLLFFLMLFFVLFFITFFSLGLSWSCFHGREVSELTLVDSYFFHVVFLLKFSCLNIFLLRNLLCCFFGFDWCVSSLGLKIKITSFKC
jgi:hypothetical protein